MEMFDPAAETVLDGLPPKPVIGVLQLLPLPGSANWGGDLTQVLERAEQEANALLSGGVDAILLENTDDYPYPKDRIDPAGAIAMAQIAHRIRQFGRVTLGISVLANDPESALAIALNVDAAFIRVPVLVGTQITESGMMPGKINELTAYQQLLQVVGQIAVLADVTMNHIVPAPQWEAPWKAPHAYLAQVMQTIEKHPGVDGLIFNQAEVSAAKLYELRSQTRLKLWVGDTFNEKTIRPFYEAADGLVLKRGIEKSGGAVASAMAGRPSVDPYRLETLLSVAQRPEMPVGPPVRLKDLAAGSQSA